MPIGHVAGVGSLRIHLLKVYLCAFDPTISYNVRAAFVNGLYISVGFGAGLLRMFL